jgi:hypothetical protein
MFARILIEAGANQAVHDSQNNNLVHLLLRGIDGEPCLDADEARDMLDLLDPSLIPSLLTERSSEWPGSLTPIARWLHRDDMFSERRRCTYDVDEENSRKIAVLALLLEYGQVTGQKHLEVIDTDGDTALHIAVKHDQLQSFVLMADCRPDLLSVENSNGCTAAELAEAYSEEQLMGRSYLFRTSQVVIRELEYFDLDFVPFSRDFMQRERKLADMQMLRQTMYEAYLKWAKLLPKQKRRLVSLLEANEVVRKVATRCREESVPTCWKQSNDAIIAWYERASRSSSVGVSRVQNRASV